MLLRSLALSLLALVASADYIQWDNLATTNYYYPVAEVNATDDGWCQCSLSNNATMVSGGESLGAQELAVGIRGPVNLRKFAVYFRPTENADNYTMSAYFDAEQGTAFNVAFLANVGDENDCLGRGLNFVNANGTERATSPQVLDNVTLSSDQEIFIYSGNPCDEASHNCGVTRSGSDAYIGFAGALNLFLFEFSAPMDTSSNTSVPNFDMPLIRLISAQVPRTSMYPADSNCSALVSGAPELDLFAAGNTSETASNFYSRVFDPRTAKGVMGNYRQPVPNGNYTGAFGVQSTMYLHRSSENVMRGGVSFDNGGHGWVFLRDDVVFEDGLSAAQVQNWQEIAGETFNIAAANLPHTAFAGLLGAGSRIEASSWLMWLAGVLTLFL